MSTLPQASARSRWLLPAVAAATVAAVVVAVAAVRGGDGPNRPPVLRLASVAGGSAGELAPFGASVKGGTPSSNPSGSGWQLEGTLPAGPSSARVYPLPAGAASHDFVLALARALGMSGEPRHLDGGWYLVSGLTELSVSELAGRHWTYSNHGCIAGPVLDPQMGTACAVANGTSRISAAPPTPGASAAGSDEPVAPPTSADRPATPPVASAEPVKPYPAPTFEPQPVPEPVPVPQPVPENVARSAARPVLQAVGLDPATARVETEGSQRSIVVSPDVAGATVLGLDTRVSVNEHGQILDAYGWLAEPTAGATYPIITAREAFEQLRRAPQPLLEMGMPCRIVPGIAGCAPTPDRVVTGATLGLIQAYRTDREMLLVPAWLFQVRGEPTPVGVVAVAPEFLGGPETPNPSIWPTAGSEPGSTGGGSGPGGTDGSGTTPESGGPPTPGVKG